MDSDTASNFPNETESTTNNTDSMVTVPLSDRQSYGGELSTVRISAIPDNTLLVIATEEDPYSYEADNQDEPNDIQLQESWHDTRAKKHCSSTLISECSSAAEITEEENVRGKEDKMVAIADDTVERAEGFREAAELLTLDNAPLKPLLSPEDIPLPSPSEDEFRSSTSTATSRSSHGSNATPASPAEGDEVDWEKLDKTEEQEHRTEATDEGTALLLARLEQENRALATDPKSGLAVGSYRSKRKSRPPSLQQLKKLVNEDPRSSLRYSQLPTPHMTELEFWAALVSDYLSTAQRLPILTSNKIRSGIPPPLRGVVWPSIAGARDTRLMEEFARLTGESSPYEGLIGKDIGRSFPNVEMFRDPKGEGQQMLARVLKCFSLYDTKIGYCQGLGFVVGPLLMHMTDAEAFCVLVRLMDHYELRSSYLPNLSGLQLRIYQFQNLMSRHLPCLFHHLQSHNVEPLYVSQWFLSFFAVTCPLPMLLRIYDVLLLEGAAETLMRVALSLMQRNEKKLLACTEFEDIMQLLLSRSLWDPYAWNADNLVGDFVGLTSLVTKDSLQALENSYNQAQGISTGISFPQIQAAASRILGRLWVGSGINNSSKSVAIHPVPSAVAAAAAPIAGPENIIRRSPSKQSMASTLNSLETSTSEASTAATEVSAQATSEAGKTSSKSTMSRIGTDLHAQIEDLLMALNDLQREQADLARELQHEREEREEDRAAAKSMLSYLRTLADQSDCEGIMNKAEQRFSGSSKRMSILQTKHQLRDEVNVWKERHQLEASRCIDLGQRIDEHQRENTQLKDELREARNRIQDSYREKQRLEKTIQELRSRKSSSSHADSVQEPSSPGDVANEPGNGNDASRITGLREFKLLGRTNSAQNNIFPKRNSSLGLSSLFPSSSSGEATTAAGRNNQSIRNSEDSLLLELVNAKTAEAVARQELEEVKAKLETLRRLVNNPTSPLSPGSSRLSPSSVESPLSPTLILPSFVVSGGGSAPKSPSVLSTPTPTSSAGGGGFFSGWGKRSFSSTSPTTLG